MKNFKSGYVPLFVFTFLFLVGCKEEGDENICNSSNGNVEVTIVPMVNGEPLEMGKIAKDNLDRDYWFTTLKFYLSNIYAINENGESVSLADVAYFDFEPNLSSGLKQSVSASIPAGTYEALNYDLGVRQDLNEKDPAVYSNDHPLSINNAMYWTWSTQYIFIKSEGFVVDSGSNKAWFVHTGLEQNYRPNNSVPVSFKVEGGRNTSAIITLNLDEVLKKPNVIDLVENGQSHTTDNMQLASFYQENFADSFE